MDSGNRDFTCGRLLTLLRCTLPSGDQHDIAVVRLFKPCNWKPNTSIENCDVLAEERNPRFVMMKYLVRGAHIVPIFSAKEARFVLNDLVDGDIFLRAGN